jgi:3-dehydrosphinganine reductase
VVQAGAIGVLLVGLEVFLAYLRSYKAVTIPIKGRHMLITGGSSGIGLKIAKLAAAEGARISLVARDPRKLADAKRLVTEYCVTQQREDD